MVKYVHCVGMEILFETFPSAIEITEDFTYVATSNMLRDVYSLGVCPTWTSDRSMHRILWVQYGIFIRERNTNDATPNCVRDIRGDAQASFCVGKREHLDAIGMNNQGSTNRESNLGPSRENRPVSISSTSINKTRKGNVTAASPRLQSMATREINVRLSYY